ncbi:MAG: metal ABC transporter permease [Planctomycetaceae bacterium]
MIVPPSPLLSYNTLLAAVAVAAVGYAAGVVGSFGVLRRRALVGDAAAHAALPGVALAFALTGSRGRWPLLIGAALSAAASLGLLVLSSRWTRTREDAATAIVLAVSYGLGIAILSGLAARGVSGAAGLERFLLGSAAALTTSDAVLLVLMSAVAVAVITVILKEAVLVSFDIDFAASSGWPVARIDALLVAITAMMVVAGLPAVGAVLVTALTVIPPAAARQWTDRVRPMLAIAGVIGTLSGLAGVVASGLIPRLPTGPAVVLAAAMGFALSLGARLVRERWRMRSWSRHHDAEAVPADGSEDAA